MKFKIHLVSVVLLHAFCPSLPAAEANVGKDREIETLVADTHQKSLEARKQERLATLAKKPWPGGPWGDTTWALTALYQNEKVEEANAMLLKNATAYVTAIGTSKDTDFKPEDHAEQSPWAYFAMPDYVRILCLFRAGSAHFPGRLIPETEAAMKAALWIRVKSDSKVADAAMDNLLVLLGTENHDLTLRPSYYLIASVLKDDPAYRERRYDDGKTAREHYDAYNKYFQKWACWRARYGLWVEVGSDGYQKYSYPSIFNLADLSPDPVVKKQFTMLLDVAFIEEAQISVNGRRGGGRSRAGYGGNSFESYKKLLYAPDGKRGGTSHSGVIETSGYQLPAAAILLRYREFPAAKPFVIENRVLGELTPGEDNRFAADSALVNYAWRTPHLILGSTLQNPALAMPDQETGKPTLRYSGISRQKRWCGVLFDDEDLSAIYPEFEERGGGGREQHPFWSVQHQNVLLVQRITPDKKGLGSYNTGWIGVRFNGKELRGVERDGWIFAAKGEGYTGVRFLDGGYEWDEKHELAIPLARHRNTSTSRVLFIAGDVETHGSFEKFQNSVVASPLTVETDKVEFSGAVDGARLKVFRYNVAKAAEFKLPEINGVPVNLRPQWTYKSPYLNAPFGKGRLDVTVGSIHAVYDFEETKVK